MEDSTSEATMPAIEPGQDSVTTDELEELLKDPDPEPESTDGDSSADAEGKSDLEEEAEKTEPEEVEEIEFDFGGQKLRVPKDSVPEEIAERLDQFTKGTWAEYTKKSQAIAEKSKSLEQQAAAIEQMTSLHDETLQAYSKGLAIKQELEQLNAIDVNELWQSDPDQARRVSDAIAQKQAAFNNAYQEVNQKELALNETKQAELARRFTEGKQLVEKRLKGFEKKAPEVVDYVVKNYGYTKEQAETWPLNPAGAEMAYKAMLFDRLQSKAKKQVKPKPATAKPVKAIRGKGGVASKDPAKMSPEEYRKWRLNDLKHQ